MEDFIKIVRLGTGRWGDIFAKITFRGDRLSIVGVEGPKLNGDAYGGCGQIYGSYLTPEQRAEIKNPAPKWDAEKIAQFFATWKRWHLNDMRAGSPAQEEYLRAHPVSYSYPKSHYDAAREALSAAGLHPDPSNGYLYGSAWLTEPVPADVLEWLRALPDADIQPAWV